MIISLLKRPVAPAKEDFFAINVALTRIKKGEDFRIICDPNDLNFVESLKSPDSSRFHGRVLVKTATGVETEPTNQWP